MSKTPVDKWIIEPVERFIRNSSTSGIVLFSSALLAILISNTPWVHQFNEFWEIELTIGFNGHQISKSIHQLINDGLMAVFFFVVGLELKREIVAGELRDPKNAVLPVVAAIGGMILPALIFLLFNHSAASSDGWGIPMATDIAFALGIMLLLGDKVPLSLKIFLTTLAIVDDIGSVLVIAFFYTSNIDFVSLGSGLVFMAILIVSNLAGVRNTMFYAIVGIGGLWLAFLVSGVHPTIAAVLAAMTIPVRVKINKDEYKDRIRKTIDQLDNIEEHHGNIVTEKQLNLIESIQVYSKNALTPLQRLEHRMYPVVAFVILPVFAFSNSGVTFTDELSSYMASPVFYGVFFGLLVGKVIGVFGIVFLLLKFRWISMPEGMNLYHMLGAGFLAAVGFTMSLFIGKLAFTNSDFVEQSKIGVLMASATASIIGYTILRYAYRIEKEKSLGQLTN